MAEELNPHFVDLVYNATLKSFWRKRALARFLRQCGISAGFVDGWTPDETKRDLLDRLFPTLLQVKGGTSVVLRMGRFLAEQTTYPDLQGWEDSALKIAEATAAVAQLKAAIDARQRTEGEERARAEARRHAAEVRAEAARSRQELQRLQDRLEALTPQTGTQQAGYDFQDWFYDLADFFEIPNRRPYKHGGREIDGSLTWDGTTYLVELKFTTAQAGAPDVDVFRAKVTSKADNTMGIMASMSGYTSIAIEAGSQPRTPLLLMDHAHLYTVLRGAKRLEALIERLRRHARRQARRTFQSID